MAKHQFAQQLNQGFSLFFEMSLYMYCRLFTPNFLSIEHFLGKILKFKLGMKNLIEKLLDFILSGNSAGLSCRGIVLLTDICLACWQVLFLVC